MLQSLTNLFVNNVAATLMLSVVAIFVGVTIVAKFESKFGYVVMALAAIVIFITVRGAGII